MGRAKLKMQLISKEKTRNVTFKKRKEGLIRKLHEFTTLCDVSACIIIYGPRNKNGSTSEPEIWPRNLERVQTMIEAYRSKNNNDYGSIKTFGLSDFFQERERKVKDEIEKLRKKNKDSKYPTRLDGVLSSLSEENLREFGAGLSNKAENVRNRIELLKRNKQSGLMVDSSLVNFGHDQSFFNQIQQQNDISTTNFGMQCYNYNPSTAYDGLDQNPLMMLLMNQDEYCSRFRGPPMFNSQAYYDSNMVGPTALVPQPVPSMFSGGAPMPLQMASREGYMDLLCNQEDIINHFLMMNQQPMN